MGSLHLLPHLFYPSPFLPIPLSAHQVFCFHLSPPLRLPCIVYYYSISQLLLQSTPPLSAPPMTFIPRFKFPLSSLDIPQGPMII